MVYSFGIIDSMNKRSVIIYADEIYRIGGIETWLYNLTEVIKDHFDILILYCHAAAEQLERLNVKYEKYIPGKKYYCDILLNLIGGRPHSISAGHIVQMVHANYAQLPPHTKYQHWNRVNSFIFVSEAAKVNFTYPVSKDNYAVLPNPIAKPKIPPKTVQDDGVLRFMAATRLTEEKGGARIAQFIRLLNDKKINFIFDIWTTWDKERFVKAYGLNGAESNLFLHEPKLDLRQEMVNATYVCQFSDCESFCYTIYEALSLHTPVLVTDWMGVRNVVRNGLNGYIYDMGLTNVDLRQLKRPPHTFGALPNSTKQWIRYLQNIPLMPCPKRPYNYFLNK